MLISQSISPSFLAIKPSRLVAIYTDVFITNPPSGAQLLIRSPRACHYQTIQAGFHLGCKKIVPSFSVLRQPPFFTFQTTERCYSLPTGENIGVANQTLPECCLRCNRESLVCSLY